MASWATSQSAIHVAGNASLPSSYSSASRGGARLSMAAVVAWNRGVVGGAAALAGSAKRTVCASRRKRSSQFCSQGLPSSSLWGSFHSGPRSASSAIDLCPCLFAKRKFNGGHANEGEEELDDDLRLGLNEISTEALKAMLSEDHKLVDALREKVDYLGEYLIQEEQLDAARFMLVVRGMLDHEIYLQKDDLKGAYKKAFDKIANVIEDSGWVLKQPGDDVAGPEMVDDELIPPVLNTQY